MQIKSFLNAATMVMSLGLGFGLGGCGTDDREGGYCGGLGGGDCDDDEFCDYATAQCGANDVGGTCMPRPGSCLQDHTPVVGSDGEIYSNACLAHANGADDCGSAATL